MKLKTISDDYRALNAELHTEVDEYGVTGAEHIEDILKVARHFSAKTIRDYGCGKGLFKKAMAEKAPDIRVFEYDPAIPGKDKCSGQTDMVNCGDVMEHIEPDLLPNVLEHIQSIMRTCGVFSITHVPAAKTLSDGRNAHLIVEPYPFWEAQLKKYFRRVGLLTEGKTKSGEAIYSVVFVEK